MDTPALLDHLRTESVRFLDAIRQADPEATVPTCPDWSAADLLWHLGGEVQWFWASVIEQDLRDEQQVVDLPDIERPTDHDALLALFTEESARLHRVASTTDPAEPRWMWTGDAALHQVGYIARRQAHEALVHRIDAELAAGLPVSPVDPAFAADGVDEALRCMHGNHPTWGSFAPGSSTVRVRADDTDDSWLLALGRFTGTDARGDAVDVASWQVHDHDDARDTSATVTGTAADLDLWLWGRPAASAPTREGAPDVLGIVAEIVGDGVD